MTDESDVESDSNSISDTNSNQGEEEKDRKSAHMKGSSTSDGLDIDEMSWDQLPSHAQKAAGVLGINREMWNADEEPESSNKYWRELTPAEQKAAKTLGYTEARWDVESESSSDDES